MRIYDLWRTERQIFEYYQSVQPNRRRFAAGSKVASFVVDPEGQTLFVGLYNVLGRREAFETDLDPILKWPRDAVDYIHKLEKRAERAFFEDLLTLLKDFLSGDVYIHRLEKRAELVNYEGKLIIDWGPGTRAILQYAGRQEKPILNLRRIVD